MPKGYPGTGPKAKARLAKLRPTTPDEFEPIIEVGSNGGSPTHASIQINLPADGLRVQLKGKHAEGTLLITSQGVLFMRAHAKKKPQRPISWNNLTRLMELGFI